jgi:nucleotide-binding universal stress UspA family protein
MNASKYILLAVDDSEATTRAVTYVASIIEGQPGFRLCLLHVFAPLPPQLLEFGGAENPAEEERWEAVQKDARTQWIAGAKACADDLFAKAQSILRTAGVPAHAVETQLAIPLSGEAVVTNILEGARANQCGTVVVGRQSFSWLQELFQHHIGEELIRRGQGLAIWVVE